MKMVWMQDGLQPLRALPEKKNCREAKGGGGSASCIYEGLPVPGLFCVFLRLFCCDFPEPLSVGFAVRVPAVRRVILQAKG